MPEREEATTTGETYHRHDDPVTGAEEQKAVTDRPNDTPLRDTDKPAVPNSTFGDRQKTRTASAKAVQPEDAENKAVEPGRAKRTASR